MFTNYGIYEAVPHNKNEMRFLGIAFENRFYSFLMKSYNEVFRVKDIEAMRRSIDLHYLVNDGFLRYAPMPDEEVNSYDFKEYTQGDYIK